MYSSKFLDNSSRSSQAVLSSSEAQTDCANICHTWKTYLNSVQTNKRFFFFLRLCRTECLYTAYFDRNEGFYPHFDLKADHLFHSFMWIPTLVACALLLLYPAIAPFTLNCPTTAFGPLPWMKFDPVDVLLQLPCSAAIVIKFDFY